LSACRVWGVETRRRKAHAGGAGRTWQCSPNRARTCPTVQLVNCWQLRQHQQQSGGAGVKQRQCSHLASTWHPPGIPSNTAPSCCRHSMHTNSTPRSPLHSQGPRPTAATPTATHLCGVRDVHKAKAPAQVAARLCDHCRVHHLGVWRKQLPQHVAVVGLGQATHVQLALIRQLLLLGGTWGGGSDNGDDRAGGGRNVCGQQRAVCQIRGV
jgi:hypothetical protein